MFGFIQPCGVCNYAALRKYVMTDELLDKLNLSLDSYKSMRLFNLKISERLVFELAITPKMLESVGINIIPE